jgi:hypothetical protein
VVDGETDVDDDNFVASTEDGSDDDSDVMEITEISNEEVGNLST